MKKIILTSFLNVIMALLFSTSHAMNAPHRDTTDINLEMAFKSLNLWAEDTKQIEMPLILDSQEIKMLIDNKGTYICPTGQKFLLATVNPEINKSLPLCDVTYLTSLGDDICGYLVANEMIMDSLSCHYQPNTETEVTSDNLMRAFETECRKKSPKSFSEIAMRSGRNLGEEAFDLVTVVDPVNIRAVIKFYRLFPAAMTPTVSSPPLGHIALISLNTKHRLKREIYVKVLAEHLKEIQNKIEENDEILGLVSLV